MSSKSFLSINCVQKSVTEYKFRYENLKQQENYFTTLFEEKKRIINCFEIVKKSFVNVIK